MESLVFQLLDSTLSWCEPGFPKTGVGGLLSTSSTQRLYCSPVRTFDIEPLGTKKSFNRHITPQLSEVFQFNAPSSWTNSSWLCSGDPTDLLILPAIPDPVGESSSDAAYPYVPPYSSLVSSRISGTHTSTSAHTLSRTENVIDTQLTLDQILDLLSDPNTTTLTFFSWIVTTMSRYQFVQCESLLLFTILWTHYHGFVTSRILKRLS